MKFLEIPNEERSFREFNTKQIKYKRDRGKQVTYLKKLCKWMEKVTIIEKILLKATKDGKLLRTMIIYKLKCHNKKRENLIPQIVIRQDGRQKKPTFYLRFNRVWTTKKKSFEIIQYWKLKLNLKIYYHWAFWPSESINSVTGKLKEFDTHRVPRRQKKERRASICSNTISHTSWGDGYIDSFSF